MTGQEFTDGAIFFVIGVLAVCVPAAVATLLRKFAAEPEPSPNVAANILLPPLIYVGGFFIAWAIMVFIRWDGSKPIEHLIISPVAYVVWPSVYAALVGAATALFSIPLPRGVKLAPQHVTICWMSQLGMAFLMMYAYSDYQDYISRVDAAQQPQQVHVPPPQQLAPISQPQPQVRTETRVDRQEQNSGTSQRSSPPASRDYASHDSQRTARPRSDDYVPRSINEPPKPVSGTPHRLPSWNEMRPRPPEESQLSENLE